MCWMGKKIIRCRDDSNLEKNWENYNAYGLQWVQGGEELKIKETESEVLTWHEGEDSAKIVQRKRRGTIRNWGSKLCRERGQKQEIEFFNSMTCLRSTGHFTDMHKYWIGRPMLHEEQEPSWVCRPTFPVSPVKPEEFVQSTERSTAHLGQSTGRSTDSQVRTVSGPDLEQFWGFFFSSL